jgi:hypothetical protein
MKKGTEKTAKSAKPVMVFDAEITVRVSAAHKEVLKKEAAKQKKKVSELVREVALERYPVSKPKKKKEDGSKKKEEVDCAP